MSNDLYLVLEDCLTLLEQGEDLETCLQKHPADADRLRLLLAAAIQTRALADDWVSQEVMHRNRVKFLNQAAKIRDERGSLYRRTSFSFQRALRFSFALLLAVVILVGVGSTGLVSASSASLPGDSLFEVKLTWENIRLRLTNSEQERVSLEDKFEQERLTEVGGLFSQGRQEKVKFSGRVDIMLEGGVLVSGVPVMIASETRVEGQIPPGVWVEVEGRTVPGGVVDALRIRMVSSKTKESGYSNGDQTGTSKKGESGNGSDGESWNESINSGASASNTPSGAGSPNSTATHQEKQSFSIQGVITALTTGSIKLDGRFLILDGEAEIHGQLAPGAMARVRGFIDAAGNWVATRIDIDNTQNNENQKGGASNSGNSGKTEPTKTPKP